MLRRSNEIKFIDINFAPKKDRFLFLKEWKSKFKESKNDFLLYSLSAFTFLVVISLPFILSYIEGKQNLKIQQLEKLLIKKDRELAFLKRKEEHVRRKFYKFYIPSLKEKLFLIAFYKKAIPKLSKTKEEIKNFLKAFEGSFVYIVYPNPLIKWKSDIKNLGFFKKEYGIYYIPTKYADQILLKPELITENTGIPIITKPMVVLQSNIKIDKKFINAINKLKNEDLKANLLLEYILTKTTLKNISLNFPMSFIVPFHLNIPNVKVKNILLNGLKESCSATIITAVYKEIEPGYSEKEILDGFCIKNIY